METREYTVEAEEAGMRIDAFLAGRCSPELSRARIQSLIRAGDVTVGGVDTAAAKRRVKEGEAVALRVPAPAEPEPEPEDIPLTIVFEDADLVVVDKPAGLVVHPGPGNWSGTLVNALLHYCGEELSGINGVKRPGIVHRLDKDTSGLLVIAKTDMAHRSLAEQFAAHGSDGRMVRSYRAIVWGTPVPAVGRIETMLGRSSSDRLKRDVVAATQPDARQAITDYRILAGAGRAAGAEASLVECRLATGRTHQIRVHMAHIGHPLIGDVVYASGFASKAKALEEPARTTVEAFRRQALHAAELGFVHPVTGDAKRFSSDLPTDMRELAAALGIALSGNQQP
ncbi:Prenyl group binding site (CAAX box):RNA-binding S4:Pseudouridine synthase:Pseudouridine synthase, Rlu:Pseudouridine [Fulvimarina pelagi HTCC2506]|uniref:Pseudouridine synthase n=2 Tax=Fulvimarina pelagi TaxID=217511 RepID=Q0FZ68_9HYPH|nr:RluA family pseudouridine synthase [Fulvimarina pelagi]EAU40410.1 Prenyl group binding site (CAAX box):RNA-binding S4:Pseudouridine synthase:Pseudouridine synthase, Rlu:Pseudouridine [Fulvimarina pelagi HTCC2506]BAT31443.1 pseudouridine synthase [Fulvimarina pelagi]